MYKIALLLSAIALVFCWAVYSAYRSWPKMGPKRQIASLFLLTPHFLILVCIVVSLLCGHPPQGSPCFNRQFVCAVLLVFILPLPALVGTLLALIMFKRARM